MEDQSVDSSKISTKKGESPVPSKKPSVTVTSAENSKRIVKPVKPGVTPVVKIPGSSSNSTVSTKKRVEGTNVSSTSSNSVKPPVTRPTLSSSLDPVKRRSSTGGLAGNKSEVDNVGKRSTSSVSDSLRRSSTTEPRRASLPAIGTKTLNKTSDSLPKKQSPLSPAARVSRTLSDGSRQSLARKPSLRESMSGTTRVSSSSIDSSSSSGSTLRKSSSKLLSPSARSPSLTSSSRSLSSSVDRGSTLSSRRKASTADSRDSRLIMLPQVEIKAGDDVRVDLRGHKVRSLIATGSKLSPNLEFVYLRDNLLSSLEGIEVLTRVKVLDLSFNEFKGPGFEPLGSCKMLQQLYLAGNQITSLASLPQLPNLEE